MKILKAILCVALLSSSSFAQTKKTAQTDYIEITATAEKEVVPDEIHIEICIDERIEKGKKITIQQQEDTLKKELQTIGIPLNNLSISDLNANIAKIGWWKKEVLASANYNLKVNDASKLKEVFKIFDTLNIQEAHITSATHSKIVALKKENRIDAIVAAKEKSDYLLTAIGQKTGKPMEIREISSNHQTYATANYVGNIPQTKSYLQSQSTAKKGSTQFEKIKLSSTIYVKFRIQ